MILITTIKKSIRDIRVSDARETAARILPYFGCIFFVEMVQFMLAVFFVYGKGLGVPFGIIAFGALSAAVIGAFYRSAASRFALLFLCDLHIALTAAMFVRAFGESGSGVAPWLFIFRSAALPWEIAAVVLLTGRSESED